MKDTNLKLLPIRISISTRYHSSMSLFILPIKCPIARKSNRQIRRIANKNIRESSYREREHPKNCSLAYPTPENRHLTLKNIIQVASYRLFNRRTWAHACFSWIISIIFHHKGMLSKVLEGGPLSPRSGWDFFDNYYRRIRCQSFSFANLVIRPHLGKPLSNKLHR